MSDKLDKDLETIKKGMEAGKQLITSQKLLIQRMAIAIVTTLRGDFDKLDADRVDELYKMGQQLLQYGELKNDDEPESTS